MSAHSRTTGFTLIELSIVLVIIGLLVGGVLVGRTLINSAEIRGTISQIEKFDTAANTFKLKYGYLPGDIPPATAASFGLLQLTGSCTGACTNTFGNGIIDESNNSGTPVMVERYVFWRHLAEANLIQLKNIQDTVSFTHYISTASGDLNSFATGYEDFFLPQAKLNRYYFMIDKAETRQSTANGAWLSPNITDYELYLPGTGAISPNSAYSIDSKIDDGKPNTGRMVDLTLWFIGAGSWATSAATATAASCTFGGSFYYSADVQYNTASNSGSDSTNCAVRIKTGF